MLLWAGDTELAAKVVGYSDTSGLGKGGCVGLGIRWNAWGQGWRWCACSTLKPTPSCLAPRRLLQVVKLRGMLEGCGHELEASHHGF